MVVFPISSIISTVDITFSILMLALTKRKYLILYSVIFEWPDKYGYEKKSC